MNLTGWNVETKRAVNTPDLKSLFSRFTTYAFLALVTFLVVFLYGLAGPSAVVEVFTWAEEVDDALFLLVAPVLGAYAGAFLILLGFHEYGEYNLVRNTPTSTIRSAPVGRVEIKGTASAIREDDPLTSPFEGTPCLAYDCTIEEYRSDDDGGNWETIYHDRRAVPLYLDDDTGRIVVDPGPAEWSFQRDFNEQFQEDETPPRIRQYVEENVNTSNFLDVDVLGGEHRRFRSRYIAPGDTLYVLGGARSIEERPPGVDPRVELMLGADEPTGTFLVSDSSETQILNELYWKSLGCVGAGILLLPGCLVALVEVLGLA